MAVGASIAQLQAAGVQVIISFSIPTFTAVAEASAAGLHYAPQFVVSNVGSDPPTLTAILTGGALGTKLPAALIDGTISDSYLPLESDTTNPWIALFQGIKTTYAPSLPWDGNVLYGLAQAYTFVQALKAAGQNPNSSQHRQGDRDEPLDRRSRTDPVRLLIEQPPRVPRCAGRADRHQRHRNVDRPRADDR